VLQNRDRCEFGAWDGPGSAVHRFAPFGAHAAPHPEYNGSIN
jgi:hypothetical protein